MSNLSRHVALINVEDIGGPRRSKRLRSKLDVGEDESNLFPVDALLDLGNRSRVENVNWVNLGEFMDNVCPWINNQAHQFANDSNFAIN